MIDYKYAGLFEEDNVIKQWIIDYGSGRIENEDLDSQSIELTENLCSEPELRFGCCESSCLKFKCTNIAKSLAGTWLTVSVILNHHEDEPFLVGKYKVESDKLTADRMHREVIAYDAMHDIIKTDVSEWYNFIFRKEGSTISIKGLRIALAIKFGLFFKEQELINDAVLIEKTINPESLSGKDILSAICEINGCFCRINRKGWLAFVYLDQDTMGLYPSETLYPDHAPDYLPQSKTERLYPQEPDSFEIRRSNCISCQYEDYVVKPITKLQIRQEEQDVGVIVPQGEVTENDNCYVIEDNFLVYGKGAEEMTVIAQNILRKITDIVYRPFAADVRGNLCLEVGDAIRISTRYDIVESYILNRNIKGGQALRDNISSQGVEKYAEKINSVQKSIVQLKGKTNMLERNVEQTRSTITDVEQGLQSEILQKADEIKTTVSKSTSKYDTLDYNVTLFGFEDAGAIKYKPSENNGKYYLNQDNGKLYRSNGTSWVFIRQLKLITENLSSQIDQTADRITQEVADRTEAGKELSSRIEQTVKSISLKVENGDKQAGIKIYVEKEGSDGKPIETEAQGKIDMSGLVSFTNLSSNDGTTVINGGNIKTGQISCDRLNGGTIKGQTFQGGTIVGANIEGKNAYYLYDSDFDDRYRIVYFKSDNTSDTELRFGRLSKNEMESGFNYISFKDISQDKEFHVYSGNAYMHCPLDVRHIYSDGYIDFMNENEENGIRAYGPDGRKHFILGYSPQNNNTHVGMPKSDLNSSTTILQGNQVNLESASGMSTVSDARLKNSFKPLDEFDSVYMDIEPCAFKYNAGTSGRYHFGVKAQNVKEAFEKNGYTTQDFGGFVQMSDDPQNEDYCGIKDPMGIIYTEFTMWNMHKIQRQQKEIEFLHGKLAEQQQKLEKLRKDMLLLMERIDENE